MNATGRITLEVDELLKIIRCLVHDGIIDSPTESAELAHNFAIRDACEVIDCFLNPVKDVKK